MKSETKGIVRPISKEALMALTKETKETLATDVISKPLNHRKFGALDLWNSRRRQRTMTSMRRFN